MAISLSRQSVEAPSTGVADQPRAAGEFEDDVQPAKSGLLRPPANFGEPGEVGVGGLVAQGGRAVSLAGSIPDVKRIVGGRIVVALLHALPAGTIQRQQHVRIAQVILRDGSGGGGFLEIFAEEQRRPAGVGGSRCAGASAAAARRRRTRNFIRSSSQDGGASASNRIVNSRGPSADASVSDGAPQDFVRDRRDVSFAQDQEPQQIADRISLGPLKVAVRQLPRDLLQVES